MLVFQEDAVLTITVQHTHQSKSAWVSLDGDGIAVHCICKESGGAIMAVGADMGICVLLFVIGLDGSRAIPNHNIHLRHTCRTCSKH